MHQADFDDYQSPMGQNARKFVQIMFGWRLLKAFPLPMLINMGTSSHFLSEILPHQFFGHKLLNNVVDISPFKFHISFLVYGKMMKG